MPMTRFTFTRIFTAGTLKGIACADAIEFPSRARFEEWVAGVNSNNAKGEIDYRVEVVS